VGAVLVLVGLFSPISGWVETTVYIIAAIALLTGIFGFYPLWNLLHIFVI
jgi:hypothetical protein